ncbi:MAG TPA: SGNH/GDSL hydrolase family protein [Nocardioidaceae bacterium]|nr:SGNH/GDSL hydrolase family protein [Nocardioidaceae bacterium]
MSRPSRLLAAAIAGALLLGACSAEEVDSDRLRSEVNDAVDDPPAAIERYVALGDSFTAGPLVPITDLAGGCFRSDNNYPALVADRLDVDRLVDVSCSGAETADLTRPQRTVQDSTVPPQLDVLGPGTDLVTIGIGGNDFDLFHTLVATCSRLRTEDPAGSPCAEALEARGIDLVATARRISGRVTTALREIQDRAPKAKVVLVGYLRITPPSGGCEDLGFARDDNAYGERVSRTLNTALARAARRAGVEFIDMYAASEGHDVCSDEAWVNGRRTVRGEALAFHPFAEGMEAVADEVVDALSG